ncbi:MAG: hypothetical protein H0T51_06525 [Pirellulales bacterium]|nr:hypothetical protein [Pirellulales bacterium]
MTTQSIGPTSIIANRSGSVGNVFIQGDDTLWQHNGKIVVGNFGTGAAHVTDGGNVISSGLSVGESIEGGQGSLGLGSVEIDEHGSRWTTPSLVIGDRGTGEVRVTNGGLLNVANQPQSQLQQQTILGKQTGSFGRLIVSGPDSRWVDSRQTIVGDQGTGELWIEDGALVNNAGATIGRSSTSNGLAVVRGEHTHWQAANITVGGDSRGALQTNGLLEILDGATVALGGTGSEGLSIFSLGRVRLDRGTIAGASQKFVTNSGVLEGDGAVTGAIVTNRQGGVVRVGEDQRLLLSAGLTMNQAAESRSSPASWKPAARSKTTPKRR